MEESETRKSIIAFLQLLGRFRDEDAAIYNAIAPGYDRFARTWDETLAKPALNYLLETGSKHVANRGKILDAGCGTGLRIPAIIHHLRPEEIIGLDISNSMLDMAQRKHYPQRISFLRGNLYSLPFEDNSFDAVIATWTIETTRNPGRAVQELLRIVKPEGLVAYSFVQVPKDVQLPPEISDITADAGVSDKLREALSPGHLPFHNCEKSDLRTFANGLISTVILGKCCSISPRMLPNPFDEF